ncbi:MAG: cell division protein FtsA [Micavibrio sp.]|nr:cell division protein FtsA [Micavibrio sp.]|tara:strand:+ start:59542 stop:60810 length:1269 start_codon:yes stop_codon:yes gene_type:complete
MSNSVFPKDSVFAALDVGSTKIACIIARTIDDKGGLEIVGVGHQKSKGIKNGVVVDIAQAEEAIRQTVHTAETMAQKAIKGFPLRDMVLSVPAFYSDSHAVDVDIQILGQKVTEHDIKRALSRAQSKATSEARELIHTIPVGYTLDGKPGIQDPLGMTGHRLGVDIHLLDGDLSALKNLANCVERSHLDIVALCNAPYAAALSTLVEDEMELGCTLIDIGGGSTSFAVVQQNRLLYAGGIPVGGQNVTSDIAQGMTTSLADAERIKTLYGSTMASSQDENEFINVPPLGEGGFPEENHVPRSLLVSIIQARMEEIFEMVQQALSDSGVANNVGRRLVLTGGGSMLPGVAELAQKIMNKQVRLGQPVKFTGLPDSTSGAPFSVLTGLLHYATKRADEMPHEIELSGESGSLWERLQGWFKENW